MSLDKRYVRVLVLASTLLLAGTGEFQCTNQDSGNSKSSGGNSSTGARVASKQKISENSGGFGGNLANDDQFGSAVTDLGDLEADGVRDLAVGAPFDDDGGDDKGATWVLFMDANGRVDQQQKISRAPAVSGGTSRVVTSSAVP